MQQPHVKSETLQQHKKKKLREKEIIRSYSDKRLNRLIDNFEDSRELIAKVLCSFPPEFGFPQNKKNKNK